MFKRLFQVLENGADTHSGEVNHNGAAPAGLATNVHSANGAAPRDAPPAVTEFKSFEEIYEGLAVQPNGTYDILKVAAMTRSPYLATMSAEAKRSSLMMALEAAGVDIEDVLQDAMMRQRALDHCEEQEQKRLQQLEDRKLQENSVIQAELDVVTAQFLRRIQANLDDVERERQAFQAWQKRKQQESNRIAEAASFSVPSTAGTSSVSAVAERIRGRSAVAGD
jgi:hypothetical protein